LQNVDLLDIWIFYVFTAAIEIFWKGTKARTIPAGLNWPQEKMKMRKLNDWQS
jgi:hypothetical protein